GDEAEPKMQRLLDRLSKPIATNLTASVTGGNIDFAPRSLPDLYAGEPLVLLGRTKHLQGTLTVSGITDGTRWNQRIDLTKASQSDVVAKLWARRRIAEVEAERYSGQTSYERADASIEELGMDFHLVTSRTSLIAVDETPSRPDGARLVREELPLLLPAGWDFDHLFGVQFANGGREMPSRGSEQRQSWNCPTPLPDTNSPLRLALPFYSQVWLERCGGGGSRLPIGPIAGPSSWLRSDARCSCPIIQSHPRRACPEERSFAARPSPCDHRSAAHQRRCAHGQGALHSVEG
ncbi:MAG: hypothetical protein AAFY42_14010, partial [Pseudomonadota bacterium]